MVERQRLAALWPPAGLLACATYLGILPWGHSAALRSVAFVVALAAMVALWQRPDRRLIPVLAAFAVWLVAAGLSLLTTADINASLEAIENEVLRSVLVFGIFYMITRRLPVYRVWVMATAIGFGTLSAVAIHRYFEYGDWRPSYVPPLGDFATGATMVLPLLAGYLLIGKERYRTVRLFVGIAIALVLSAAYLSMSRAVWLVIAAGVALGVVLYAVRTRRLTRPQIVVVVTVCASAIALAAFVAWQKDRDLLYFDDRSPIYSAAFEKIRTNPLTGTGYGFETNRRWYADRFPGSSIFHPHNIVLSYLDQMGVLGGVALLMLFGAPGWLFWQGLRGSRTVATAAISGLVLLVTVLIKNNLDYFLWKHNLWLLFAHLGIYVGEIHRRPAGDRIKCAAHHTVEASPHPEVPASSRN